MSQLIQQLETKDFKGKITNLYNYVQSQQNSQIEKKLQQLAEKAMNKEYAIAFCGHFSAGKSTMINRLIGENLLPSSPIPTSANLVKVKTGEEYAKVYFKNEKPRMYLAPYNYEQVKNYCKDGDQIEWVEISHSESELPKGMVILDTPGIDSTDDAHRIATESAIHLADVIFYVMDYNHVQSEVNFLFTKDLTIAGKEIYLVINQIDKHREEELSMEAFQQSVVDSFASWGVNPKGIYYTSLKEFTHLYNQFNELQTFIHERMNHIDESISDSVFQSLNQLAKEHLVWLEEENAEEETRNLEILEQLSIDEQDHLEEKEQNLKDQLKSLEQEVFEFKKSFLDETDKILSNAYLMPFQTRELAKSFLEANQENFKVGFLFSKQKTETERMERLNRFYDDLVEKVSTELDWHLRSFFQKIMKENHIQDQNALDDCQSFQTSFTKELLVSIVKPGASLSGEYLINFTNDVTREITRLANREIIQLSEHLFKAIEKKNEEQKKKITIELNELQPYIDAKQKIMTWKSFFQKAQKTVHEIMEGTYSSTFMNDDLFEVKAEEVEIVKGFVEEEFSAETKSEIEMVSEKNAGVPLQKATSINKDAIVRRLKRTADELGQINGFEKTIYDLYEKASRIENQGFTVALFGAFSAGKSSFANALMGEDVLPVSPNPTTAAINKILPVTEQYPHGTARVKIKNAEQLLTEVARSLKVFDLEAVDFQTALVCIDKVMSHSTDFIGNEKIHFSFLRAFQHGFVHLSKSLGEVIQTDVTEFRDFVANESKSCFVEWIELYYDCELTKKGITLVDTPGADSINARHTGVAFDYIKNSDAILFVTYYNHAFSNADREFLIQLGRVKDTFELDKMFFIINAIDLANNDEELETVISYVRNQLMVYGIRNPHLFALSSLLALKEKQNKQLNPSSNMMNFENAFYQFISNDLLNTSLASANTDIERIIHEIRVLINASNQDESVKQERKKQLLEEKKLASEILSKQTVHFLEKRVTQELHELIFYIKQRVFLRFNDFFKESFNPAVIKEDGRNMKKALYSALEELLLVCGYDFSQELRATSLRMDSYLRKQLDDFYVSLSNQITELNGEIKLTKPGFKQSKQLDFENAFDHLNRDVFQKAISSFKNTKSFFEKNEKKVMNDELYQILQQPADSYLQKEGNRLSELYLSLTNESFEINLTQAKMEVDLFYQRFISLLDQKGQAEVLAKVLRNIEIK
ncbi:dynamin family protein [Bacillus sp. CGMCC 1.16607]|uniref:dynamin family protein n=1 Tax=Bacillus sp. CGMCC 1.16607 TaxID=3351842 RepID=UPI00362EF8D9